MDRLSTRSDDVRSNLLKKLRSLWYFFHTHAAAYFSRDIFDINHKRMYTLYKTALLYRHILLSHQHTSYSVIYRSIILNFLLMQLATSLLFRCVVLSHLKSCHFSKTQYMPRGHRPVRYVSAAARLQHLLFKPFYNIIRARL
jgi:hypothetical protein